METQLQGIKQCVVVTGMSGAGKTTTLKVLEDFGFFAIDNIPPMLLSQLFHLLADNQAAMQVGVAVTIDIRSACSTLSAMPIWAARASVELTVLIIGWLLGGTVGLGTVLFAATIGPLVHITLPLLDTQRKRVPSPSASAPVTPLASPR